MTDPSEMHLASQNMSVLNTLDVQETFLQPTLLAALIWKIPVRNRIRKTLPLFLNHLHQNVICREVVPYRQVVPYHQVAREFRRSKTHHLDTALRLFRIKTHTLCYLVTQVSLITISIWATFLTMGVRLICTEESPICAMMPRPHQNYITR